MGGMLLPFSKRNRTYDQYGAEGRVGRPSAFELEMDCSTLPCITTRTLTILICDNSVECRSVIATYKVLLLPKLPSLRGYPQQVLQATALGRFLIRIENRYL